MSHESSSEGWALYQADADERGLAALAAHVSADFPDSIDQVIAIVNKDTSIEERLNTLRDVAFINRDPERYIFGNSFVDKIPYDYEMEQIDSASCSNSALKKDRRFWFEDLMNGIDTVGLSIRSIKITSYSIGILGIYRFLHGDIETAASLGVVSGVTYGAARSAEKI